jgi:hypothetical protein
MCRVRRFLGEAETYQGKRRNQFGCGLERANKSAVDRNIVFQDHGWFSGFRASLPKAVGAGEAADLANRKRSPIGAPRRDFVVSRNTDVFTARSVNSRKNLEC